MSDSPQSPPKEVDHGAQSPDEEGQMNEQQDPQSNDLAGYEFEGVKEQDRWLPIANGKCQLPRRQPNPVAGPFVICPSSHLRRPSS
jgi:hypothetical protein